MGGMLDTIYNMMPYIETQADTDARHHAAKSLREISDSYYQQG
jgi:hypothetical protein